MNRKDRKLIADLANRLTNNYEVANNLKSRELKDAKERFEFEKATKDRVDISKGEYLELLEYKKGYEKATEIIPRVFYPIMKRNEEAYKKMVKGEVEEVKFYDHIDYNAMKKKLIVSFLLDMEGTDSH